MKFKKNKTHNFIVAVVFASVILTIGYLLKGLENKQIALMIVVAIWFVPFNCFTRKSKSCKTGLRTGNE